MLELLRQGATGWVAKILMGLLVLSFIGWGIFTNQARNLGAGTETLLQVGGQNITAQRYNHLFGLELQKLNLQSGRNYSLTQAHQIGLDQQIFTGLLVDAQARALNLGISDQALLDKLTSQKGLQAADGSFDKDAFRFLLRRLNMTEAEYFDTLRSDSVRSQLLGTVEAGVPAPQALVDAFNQFEGEERTLDYFIVPPSKAPAAVEPDAGKLKDFYEAHKDDYRAPEMRKLSILLASPDDIKSTVPVTDEELTAAWNATKTSFGSPERRHVQIMAFQDKAAVDQAMAEIKAGKDFMAVAKDVGLADKDVDHGMVTKGELLDSVAADAAFKLAKDIVSDPIEGALATDIIRVTEIQPGVVKTFDDAKAEIKDRLAREKAVKALLDYRGKIEDARAGGTQLSEMPSKYPFKYAELPPMTKEGLGADGKPASTIAGLSAILKTGFASDVGVESDPVDLGKDGWAWVEVKEVKPARQKALEEVKAEVTAAYQAEEAQIALGKIAQALADRANKGEDFSKLATEGGGTVSTASGLTRRGLSNPDLTKSALQLAFSMAKGSAASLSASDGKSKLVYKVIDIKAAKPVDENKRKDLAVALAQQMTSAVTAEYLAGLEKTYGFSLDQAQFQKLVGSGAADQSDQ